MNNAHTVIAILEAKPEKTNELKQALLNLVHHSLQEPTCLEYRMHQDKENPCIFIFYENWQSKEAHQAQFTKPYIQDFIDKASSLLAKPFQLHTATEMQS